MDNNIMIILLLVLAALVAIGIFVAVAIQDKKYQAHKEFVISASKSLRAIKSLNAEYSFKEIDDMDMSSYYDNEAYFSTVEPIDYLTYQLVYTKKKALAAIESARENRQLYKGYSQRVSECDSIGSFSQDTEGFDINLLTQIERNLFEMAVKRPTTKFTISVDVYETNMRGRIIGYKSDEFSEEEIEEIISKINQKRGDFYLLPEIWDSICKVERAKVSNKMRFAIYERDHHRCRICGRHTDDLEIDHIFPVSKGGKSTYDNLQTLCHRCNSEKSNSILPGAIDPRRGKQGVSDAPLCPNCKIPMALRKGKKGPFYGCPNYPRCKETRKAD